MSSRTVLIVSYHYPPSTTPGAIRVSAMARRLSARGWNVVVVTATGGSAGDGNTIDVIRTSAHAPVADGPGQPVIATPRPAGLARFARAFAIPDAYTGWGADLNRAVASALDTHAVDVVLSSSPPHSSQRSLAALHRRRRFRWVAEFRDPWMFPNRRRLSRASAAWQRHMEASVVTRCDRVIANTDGNRTELLAGVRGLDPARVVVIPNGFDAAHVSGPAPVPSSFDLTYVGEIYPGMFDVYVEALAGLRAQDPARIPTLEVFGTLDSRERRRLAERGLDRFVEHRGFVSHRESVDAMRAARALLLLLPGNDRWRTCVPSKLYWYLGARRPVIAFAPDGDAGQVLRDTGAGWLISARTGTAPAHELAAALEKARAWTGPAHSIGAYDLDALAARMHDVLAGVVYGTTR